MNKINRLVLSVILGLFTASAHASFLIEPHIGFSLGGKSDEISQTKSSNSSAWKYSNEYSGPQYGARVGYQFLGFMGGLSYNHASLTVDSVYTCTTACTSITKSYDASREDLGLFVGYNAPILLRAWLGYSFSVKQTAEGAVSGFVQSGDFKKGTATELGVGFTGLPFLSVNLVYRSITFTKEKALGVEQAQSPELDNSEVVLGVSIPLNL